MGISWILLIAFVVQYHLHVTLPGFRHRCHATVSHWPGDSKCSVVHTCALPAPGEVPNLFPRDELPGLLEEVRAASKQAGAGETPDQLYTFFLSRVKANLHVIICMSPAGSAFSRRCRMFPGEWCSCPACPQLKLAHGNHPPQYSLLDTHLPARPMSIEKSNAVRCSGSPEQSLALQVWSTVHT